MKQKVPLFVPAENFIPIEKENLSIETKQQILSSEGVVFGKDNRKGISNKSDLKQLDLQRMNSNELLRQQDRQKNKFLKTPTISNINGNGNQFDDNDFLITEDNCENGIGASLQSLDMKRYSDRNSYFNNSIRVFNLQKNRSQISLTTNNSPNNLHQMNGTPTTSNQSSRFEFTNIKKTTQDQLKQSGISIENQQSTHITTNESGISNKQSDLSIKKLISSDLQIRKDQKGENKQSSVQNGNTGQINMNIFSSSSISSINNSKHQVQNIANTYNQIANQNQSTEIKMIKPEKGSMQMRKDSQTLLTELPPYPTSRVSQTNVDLQQLDQFQNVFQHDYQGNEQTEYRSNQIQLFKDSNRQKTASFQNSGQQNTQQMLTTKPSLTRGRQSCPPEHSFRLKEDISPSPPNRSNIELQNLNSNHLLYIVNNNNDLLASERCKNQIQRPILFTNNDGLSLFPQQDHDAEREEEKEVLNHEIINDDDANLEDEQNDNYVIDFKDDSFDQNRGDQSTFQRHSIMNSNLNIFVVKKNAISSPQSARQLSMENKYCFFNPSNEDKQFQYDAEGDTSTKNLSYKNVKAQSDIEPFRNTTYNKKIIKRLDDEDSCNIKQNSIFKNDDIHNTTDNEQIKEISQILRHAERDDLKSFPQTPNNIQDNLTSFFRQQPEIINSIFQNDVNALKKFLQGFSNQQKNTVDANGNTLLYLATKLALRDDKYFDIFKYLLQNGGNPKIRNKDGWSPLDEAIYFKNVKITTTLFEYIYQSKKKKITEQFKQLDTILPSLPDCYIEIKWHFESMIPFLGYFAPSDTFRFWKVGTNFRLDTTLVGFNNLKCKRRNMSLIFKDQKLYLINKSNKTITDPQEQLDTEEKKKIIQDLLESKPFQSTFDVTQCTVQQSKTWNGKIVKKKIANYNAEQYSMKLVYEYVLKNKSSLGEGKFDNYENYQKSLKLLKGVNSEPPKRASSICNSTLNSNTKKESLSTSNSKEKETKKATFSIWMSKEYPIHFKEVKSLFQNEGFPVKIQIPLNYTIKSTIDFSDFKFLNNNTPDFKDLFNIDPTFQVIARKIAQKTLTRAKKRMILANMITA